LIIRTVVTAVLPQPERAATSNRPAALDRADGEKLFQDEETLATNS
jgi:hypothetical protein